MHNLPASFTGRILAVISAVVLFAGLTCVRFGLSQEISPPTVKVKVPQRHDPATTDWLRQQLSNIDELLAEVTDPELSNSLRGQLLGAQAFIGDIDGLDANLARFRDIDAGMRMLLLGQLAQALACDGRFDEAYRIADRLNVAEFKTDMYGGGNFQSVRDSVFRMQAAQGLWREAFEVAIQDQPADRSARLEALAIRQALLRRFYLILVGAASTGEFDDAVNLIGNYVANTSDFESLLQSFIASEIVRQLPTATKLSILARFAGSDQTMKVLDHLVDRCDDFEDWKQVCDFSIINFGPEVLPVIVPAGESPGELRIQRAHEEFNRSFPGAPITDIPAADKREGAFARNALAHLRQHFPDLRERGLANPSLAAVLAKLHLLAGEHEEAGLLFHQQNADDFQKQAIPFLISRCRTIVLERNAEQLHHCLDLVSRDDLRNRLVFSTEYSLTSQGQREAANWLIRQAASRLVPEDEYAVGAIVHHLLKADLTDAGRRLADEWLNRKTASAVMVNELTRILALDCLRRNELLECLSLLEQLQGPNRYFRAAWVLAVYGRVQETMEMLKSHATAGSESHDPGQFAESYLADAHVVLIRQLIEIRQWNTAFAINDLCSADSGESALKVDSVSGLAELIASGNDHRAQLDCIHELIKRFPDLVRLHYWLAHEYCMLGDFENMVAEFNQIPDLTPEEWAVFLGHFKSSLPCYHSRMVAIAKQKLAARSDLIGELAGQMAEWYVANDMDEEAIQLFEEFEVAEAKSAIIYQLAKGLWPADLQSGQTRFLDPAR